MVYFLQCKGTTRRLKGQKQRQSRWGKTIRHPRPNSVIFLWIKELLLPRKQGNILGNFDKAKIPAESVLAPQLKSLTNILLPGKHLTVFLAAILTFLSAVRSFVYVFWPKSVLIQVGTKRSAGNF